MGKRLQVYQTDGITVTFDPNVCLHSGVCLRTLPDVFDVQRQRWIRPELAAPDAVAAAVRKCPSGALQYHLSATEAATPEPTGVGEGSWVRVLPAGPLVLEGPVVITEADGTLVRKEGPVALCRCGGSGTKPYCDGTHTRIGFVG